MSSLTNLRAFLNVAFARQEVCRTHAASLLYWFAFKRHRLVHQLKQALTRVIFDDFTNQPPIIYKSRSSLHLLSALARTHVVRQLTEQVVHGNLA